MKNNSTSNNRKIRIAVLSDYHPDEVLGGGGIIAYEFFNLLLNLGIESQFWCTYSKKLNIDSSNSSVKLLKSIPSRFRFINYLNEIMGLFNVMRLIKFIYAFRPDTIWVNQVGNRFSFLSILVFKFFKIKVVVTLHDYLVISKYKITPKISNPANLNEEALANPLSLVSKIRHVILRFYVNLADEICCVSYMQGNILKNFGIKVTEIINNGITTCDHLLDPVSTWFDIDKPILKNENQKLVLFAGRMNGKGLNILTKSIQRSGPSWKLILAGEIELSQYCNENLNPDQFLYLGRLHRQELLKLIHEIDLVAVISQYCDPYPTIALEAVTHGSVFFTTEVAGVSDLLNFEAASFLISKIGEIPNLSEIYFESQMKKYIFSSICEKILPPKEVLVGKYLPLFS